MDIKRAEGVRKKIVGYVSIEEALEVQELIEREKRIHRGLQECMWGQEIYIIGLEDRLEKIKVMSGKIVKEELDGSYRKYQEIKKMTSEEIRYILRVECREETGFEVQEVSRARLECIRCIKAKEMVYGVTDGGHIESIKVKQVDVEGVCEEEMQEIMEYSYRQSTQAESGVIESYLVSYT